MRSVRGVVCVGYGKIEVVCGNEEQVRVFRGIRRLRSTE